MKIIDHIKGISSSIFRYVLNKVYSPIVVLLYHRVIDTDDDIQQLCVSKDNFYLQIEYLKKKFNVLHPDEFCEALYLNKKLKKGSILITFDDGYYDNYENAFPILRSLNASALFFVATSNIDKPSIFFWDELDLLFKSVSNKLKFIHFDFDGIKYRYDISSPKDKIESYYKIHNWLKYSKERARNVFLSKLHIACETDENIFQRLKKEFRIITSEEIKIMSSSNFAVIGAHTHTHSPLSVYNYNEQYTDISVSKSILEKITGRKQEYFSYPFGSYKDYGFDSIEICRRLGFKLAFANYYDQARCWTDKFQIPRMIVRNWEFDSFKKHINKYFTR